MQQNIAENNRFIAEFMNVSNYICKKGSGKDQIFYENVVPNHSGMSTNDLKYHNSWDWLMPAVIKIQSLSYESFELNDALVLADFNAIYKIVVRYIKWYNKKDGELNK